MFLRHWRCPAAATTLVVFLVGTLMSGCGGGGGAGGGGGSPQPTNRGVAQEGVVVLPSDGSVQIAGQTGDTVTLTGNVPDLVPGKSVIVSGIGEGLMLKVIDVTRMRGGAVVKTEPASLQDVFKQAEFHVDKMLSDSDIAAVTPVADGVTVNRSPQSRTDVASTLELPLTDVVLYGDKQNGIKVNGLLKLRLGLKADCRIGLWGLEYFEFTPHGTATFDGKVTANMRVASRSDVPTLVRLQLRPIRIDVPVGSVGFVPIVLSASIDWYASWNGSIEAQADLPVRATVAVRAGIALDNGDWLPITELTGDAGLPSGYVPSASAQVSGRFCLSGLEGMCLVNGIASPKFQLEAPYFEILWTASSDGTTLLDLQWGVWASASVHVQVFDWKADLAETTLIDHKEHFHGFPKTYSVNGNVHAIAD